MVNWGNALLVAVLGMGIVFIVLILIMCVLLIMEKIFAPKKKTVKTAEKAETAQKAPETAPKITATIHITFITIFDFSHKKRRYRNILYLRH